MPTVSSQGRQKCAAIAQPGVKLTASMPNMNILRANGSSVEHGSQAMKSLAAIAIGLRQNQCQTALLQHNSSSVPRQQTLHQIPNMILMTPTSKNGSFKEATRFNKTTSRPSKQEIVHNENLRNPLPSAQTQHRGKPSHCSKQSSHHSKEPASHNLQTGHLTSNRNELANYLSKILLSQQQKQSQQRPDAKGANEYALSGSLSYKNASQAQKSHFYKSPQKSRQNPVASQTIKTAHNSTNMTQSLNKLKKLQNSGIVLLSGKAQTHKQHMAQYYQSQQSLRKSQRQDSSASKRDSHQVANSSAAAEQLRLKMLENRIQTNAARYIGEKSHAATMQYMTGSGRRGGNSQSQSNVISSLTQAYTNSLLQMHQNQYLAGHQNQQKVSKNSKKTRQLKQMTQNVKSGIQSLAAQNNKKLIRSQNYLLAGKIQKAIIDRKQALDLIESERRVRESEIVAAGVVPLGKSMSERQLTKSPKDDLLATGDHNTIVNIRAHDSEEGDSVGSGRKNEKEVERRSRGQSKSTKVEYHSEQALSNLTSHRLRNNRSRVEEEGHETRQRNTQEKQVQVSALELSTQKAEIGVQTSLHRQTTLSINKESEESVSHREDKMASLISLTEADAAEAAAELATWAREKQAIEMYSLFYVEQLEPFTRELLNSLVHEPQRLATAHQLLDIFGVRHEQLIPKELRQASVSADLFYKLSSGKILALQKIAKIAQDQISCLQVESRASDYEKDEQISSLKDQVRKLQKELFIRSEKLHLSEQMNKLKEKEVTTLRNKIQALAEANERAAKDHQKAIQRKDQGQELNFAKAARELKTLYEQNKELFEHNKALRDDLLDQDEKVRKLVYVIQHHPSLLHNIDHELDKTETKLHDQSQISSAIPYGQKRSRESLVRPSTLSQQNKNQHGFVYVGHNKVPIPKLDPKIIDKFTKLNIEGKLPHIVETTKFNADAVKQQVKDIFREIKQQRFDILGSAEVDQFKTPHQHIIYPAQSSSGIGNDTPFSAMQKSQDSVSDRYQQLYQESSYDISGMERKQRKIQNKLLAINSPDYGPVTQGLNTQKLPSVSQSSSILPRAFHLQGVTQPQGQKQAFATLETKFGAELQTPVQKMRKMTDCFTAAGPKKDLTSQLALAQNKQHQAQTIVTLQNQLYHQLMTQNVQGAYGTPNNHQTPISPGQDSSSQPNLLSPFPNQNLSSPQSLDILKRLAMPRHDDPLGDQQKHKKLQNLPKHRQTVASGDPEGTAAPEFQSIDIPVLQTPSQTATLALELTEGLNQIMMQQSSDIGASTAAFNQILINEPAADQQHIQQQKQLSIYQRRDRQNPRQLAPLDYVEEVKKHHHISKQGVAGGLISHNLQQQPGKSHHQVLYEEEKSKVYADYSSQQDENEDEVQALLVATAAGQDLTQQTHKKAGGHHLPGGPTLQDQISKQYSPILRRHESLEHINDFSPSLINDRNELSNAAEGQKYSLMRMQATASLGIPNQQQRTASYSLAERNGLGLTSIVDQEKSVSLLDSIAIKEEDSTQKKYIEPQASSSLVVDHGGNEQSSNTGCQILMDHHHALQLAQTNQGRFYEMDQPVSPVALHRQYSYTPQTSSGGHINHNQHQFLSEHQHQVFTANGGRTTQQHCEFEGGEAPLDISRVDDNFDSSQNHRQGNDQEGHDSADFLEDQNFAEGVPAGRRSSYDGGGHWGMQSSAEHLL